MADEARVESGVETSLVYSELVAKGQSRGFVTPEEILKRIPNPEENVGIADEVVAFSSASKH